MCVRMIHEPSVVLCRRHSGQFDSGAGNGMWTYWIPHCRTAAVLCRLYRYAVSGNLRILIFVAAKINNDLEHGGIFSRFFVVLGVGMRRPAKVHRAVV